MGTRGNIFIVGPMGAGKTTVGKRLAEQRGMEFVDSDHEIEGEAGFRAREAQTLAELTALDGIVLATGGGAVIAAENRRRLAERGTVVYLRARPEDLYERVRHDRNRPLLATADPLARLRELYAERDPLYCEIADFIADTGAQSVQALARTLLSQLQAQWKASA